MAERVIQLSEPRCTLWRVTDDEGGTHYETKVGDQRLLRFETEAKALAHYNLWVLEVRKEREQFGD